jgi:hypothetical protein
MVQDRCPTSSRRYLVFIPPSNIYRFSFKGRVFTGSLRTISLTEFENDIHNSPAQSKKSQIRRRPLHLAQDCSIEGPCLTIQRLLRLMNTTNHSARSPWSRHHLRYSHFPHYQRDMTISNIRGLDPMRFFEAPPTWTVVEHH